MTYLWLSLVFLAVSLAVAALSILRLRRRRRDGSEDRARRTIAQWVVPFTLVGVVVMALTAVFDNVMIGIGLMSYAPQHLSRLSVGAAPIEDFAYPLAALIVLPALWSLLGASRKRSAA
ncbi:lycopene cyclase domain-containing protein [Leifsonia sp. Root112D2]|jgi:lycopene cyclase domain-containing protein|uniref:lycopene cyclase domain-containing protein n=1 Tax=Leifsonia sp. Root112D2 TaxID=1736426 RepID=UPI0006F7640A|nr:lycopene cyclase domain-containing protein [Leifsonia sp. Root112D2]KQV06602.1 hypothetical protein ASC63_04055 [Leifsonia sp. Root112D2]